MMIANENWCPSLSTSVLVWTQCTQVALQLCLKQCEDIVLLERSFRLGKQVDLVCIYGTHLEPIVAKFRACCCPSVCLSWIVTHH